MGENSCNNLQRILDMCYKVYEKYSWLTDAYVSDFYVENLWERLPQTWREVFKDLKISSLAQIIDSNQTPRGVGVLPLSMLALRQTIKCLSVSRQQVLQQEITMPNKEAFASGQFSKLFWKRVKLKKRHEIELMSNVCYKLSVEMNCYNIIDVGSGLGHLSRLLAYGYGLKVCSLELQSNLSTHASKFDCEVENLIVKYCKDVQINFVRPKHVGFSVDTKADGLDILKVIEDIFGSKDSEFGIVGLHPCGDLGVTLLHLFLKCDRVKFINIVGCCYMKLSSSGFPLSKHCKLNKFVLSYAARETACHALEMYMQKLNDKDFYYLKVHAYRAGLEKLIVKHWPRMAHSQICSVKCTEDLSFTEYCRKAVSKLGILLENEEMESCDLSFWKYVVIFYSIRLMIAPLVETIILLDRLLLISQEGHTCDIKSLFDPLLSPRNQIFCALKNKFKKSVVAKCELE